MKSSLLKISTLLILISMIFVLGSCNKENGDHNNINCSNCELEPDEGLCDAYFPRYYFDKSEMKCKEFIWGGCEGVVPFETLEECELCDCQK